MNLNVYANDGYISHLKSEIAKISVHDDMKIDAVKDATLVIDNKTTAFGVFDKEGNFVESCRQYRGNHSQYIPRFVPAAEYMDCDAVFIGNVYPHFGHFLLEHLNRAWGVERVNGKNTKYILVDNQGIGAKKWMYDFLEIFGIRHEDILVLTWSVRFNKIFVPTQTLNIKGNWYAPEFNVGYNAMREHVAADVVYDKVYVSRAKLPNDMRTYGEEKIQAVFEKNGFKVIYPETLPLAQQIAIVGNCRVLAGCAGTALHLSVFMRPGGRVIQINRTQVANDNAALQYRLCLAAGLDFDVISGSVETFKSVHGGDHAPQIIGANEWMQKFWKDNKFKVAKSDLLPDEDARIEYLAQLEIFKKSHGGQFRIKFKKLFIKIVALFVPGRVNRGRVRKWLKTHL